MLSASGAWVIPAVGEGGREGGGAGGLLHDALPIPSTPNGCVKKTPRLASLGMLIAIC